MMLCLETLLLGEIQLFYFLYKTTNQINGKVYYGKHTTSDLNDGYLGSGTYLRKAIKKYGEESFVREIILFCQNVNELNQKEKELIDNNVVLDEGTYNVALGGQGGNLGPIVNKKISEQCSGKLRGPMSDDHKANISKSKIGYTRSEETTNKIKSFWASKTLIEKQEFSNKMSKVTSGENNGFHGKRHSDEVKLAQSIRAKKQRSLCSKDDQPAAKPVTLNGVSYSSKRECMNLLGVTYRELNKLLGE